MVTSLGLVHACLVLLVNDYFRNAKMSYPNAYAHAVLAMAFAEDCLDIDKHAHLLKGFLERSKKKTNYSSIIFPRNETIEKQLNDLEILQKEMEDWDEENRDLLLSIGDAPDLRVVKSRLDKE